VLIKYGSSAQKERWLTPLLEGRTRSAFLMTEPDVASSDARNVRTSIVRDGDDYVINGRKWWSTGFMHPATDMLLVMGSTNPDADDMHRHSIIIVPKGAPGVTCVRPLTVFGYDDAPHGHAEVVLRDVRVPASNIILGEGRGFEIAQGRLGPGRIHHCMRAVGLAERALQAMVWRASDPERTAFGRLLAEHATTQVAIAECRIDIDAARSLVLAAARQIDVVGAHRARKIIAEIKAFVPRLCLRVVDKAIQTYGGAGVGPDTFLPQAYAGLRSLRIADGPDVVHLRTVALLELRDQARQRAEAQRSRL
jgi:acyl-CoA dehydrogenase